MQENSREKNFAERRLKRAADYVSDRWFPINSAQLARINDGLSAGRYAADVVSLYADIRSDFALFTYCLRELASMLRRNGATVPTDPLEMFTTAGLDTLKEILAVDERTISHHRLKGMSPLQQKRFEEALLSATTAQALGPTSGVDGSMCFSTALLRQLGLTLIAWNYPMAYERAIRSLQGDATLDEAIAQILGYSPGLLAVRILESWGIDEATVAPLRGDDVDLTPSDAVTSASTAPTLATICRVGEALARANHPDIYPSAERDWAEAQSAIETRLGADGISNIRAAFTEQCASYAESLSPMFSGGIVVDPEYRQFSMRYDGLRDRNPYIARCRPHIEKRLHSFYSELAQATRIDERLIALLARDVVPAAGFTGGIVFTVDPFLTKLMPQLAIGQPCTHRVSGVELNSLADPISRAFESIAPVTTNVDVAAGGRLVSIAGVLGYSQRIGVLMLEIPRQTYVQSAEAHLTHFKAIAQSFNECLKLE